MRDSRAFLKKVRRAPPSSCRAVCGQSTFSTIRPVKQFCWAVSSAGWSSANLIILQAYGAALTEAETGQRQLVALDCGAGVGRVTEQLLLHHCAEVDLVEPSGVGLPWPSSRTVRLHSKGVSATLEHCLPCSTTLVQCSPCFRTCCSPACSPSAGGSKAAAGRACSEGGATRPQSSQFLPGKLLMLAQTCRLLSTVPAVSAAERSGVLDGHGIPHPSAPLLYLMRRRLASRRMTRSPGATTSYGCSGPLCTSPMVRSDCFGRALLCIISQLYVSMTTALRFVVLLLRR